MQRIQSVKLSRASVERRARWILEVDGRALDLSSWIEKHEPATNGDLAELFARGFFERRNLERLLATESFAPASPARELLVPVDPDRVGKILALGKNFKEHAAEFGEQVPEEPLFFDKLPETLVATGATVRPPDNYAARFDHEAELTVVIGKGGKHIAPERALEHVGGFTIANDLTLRTLQSELRNKKYPWFRSKNFDGACPLGPCIVPSDFFDLGDAHVRAAVNGVVKQDASTKDLVVDVAHAIAIASEHFTLRPLDLILMGTPSGVSALENGDEVVCSIDGIGELVTRIARAKHAVKA